MQTPLVDQLIGAFGDLKGISPASRFGAGPFYSPIPSREEVTGRADDILPFRRAGYSTPKNESVANYSARGYVRHRSHGERLGVASRKSYHLGRQGDEQEVL